MGRGAGVAQAVLLAALAVASPWAAATRTMHYEAAEPASTREAAFDETFQRVVGPASLDATSEGYEADLERLRALLPADDTARDVRFRSVYCGSLRWKDAEQGLAYADEALRRARDARDVASEARSMLCRAVYLMQTSGSKRGLPEVDKVVALLQDTQEQQLLAESLETRGDIQSLLGEQAKAMLDFQRARGLSRRRHRPRGRAADAEHGGGLPAHGRLAAGRALLPARGGAHGGAP